MSEEWLRQVEKKQKSLEDQGIQTNVLSHACIVDSQDNIMSSDVEKEKEKTCEECGEPLSEDWHTHCKKCYFERVNNPGTTFHDYDKGDFDNYDEKIH